MKRDVRCGSPDFRLDVATGTLALMVFSAGAAAIIVAVLFRVALRRAGGAGRAGLLWVCAVVFLGAIFTYALFDRFAARDQVSERRGIEARAAELTARALAPGSALGCLDAVANALVENGCEKPLFATPEAVAAAVAYVDARFSLLAASAALAERDPGYRPAFERLRQGLEADRYGFVAHVLTTRGCNGADCPELRLLRDPDARRRQHEGPRLRIRSRRPRAGMGASDRERGCVRATHLAPTIGDHRALPTIARSLRPDRRARPSSTFRRPTPSRRSAS